jgi:hypothetical protein
MASEEQNVMCALPAARAKPTSALMPMVYAIHVRDSPGMHRGYAVYARGRQAHPKPSC